MTSARPKRRVRPRGEIETLPSGSIRVRVAAGTDPVTKQRHRLTEVIPAGPLAEDEAERALRRLLVQVDEKVNPRTAATVAQLLEKHFALLEVERTTRATYENLARTHIVPLIGKVKLAALSSQIFDSFYALLRRCRLHCKGQRMVEHRVKGKHDCDHRCRRHVCKPLAQSTIRQIHVILSGALRRAVRWRWLSRNPIEHAEPPKQPPANPRPPTSAEAARIVNASCDDPDWAVLVWLTMVTGARRGELCALRWDDVDLVTGTLRVQRSIAELKTETWEKDTKRLTSTAMTAPLLEAERQLVEQTRPRIAEAELARKIATVDAERRAKDATNTRDRLDREEALASVAEAAVAAGRIVVRDCVKIGVFGPTRRAGFRRDGHCE